MSRLPLQVDELLGVVKFDSEMHYFGAWLAGWILDYPGYDPGFETEGAESYRSGLSIVRPDQGAEFCEAMGPNAIDPAELNEYLKSNSRTTPISFYIDFDSALYVNGFHEIPVDNYVPAGWNSIEDDPIQFLPREARAMWEE